MQKTSLPFLILFLDGYGESDLAGPTGNKPGLVNMATLELRRNKLQTHTSRLAVPHPMAKQPQL